MSGSGGELRIAFLGTRGGIAGRRPPHLRHASLLVAARGRRVMVDAGEDWLGRLGRLRLDAIVVTHAHPDHAGGLARGAPCPVYATEATWRLLARCPIARRDRRILRCGEPRRIAGIGFTALRVQHSILAPAIALRISSGGARVLYAPDVVAIPRCAAAMRGVDLYVGDGARITRPLLRGRGARAIGHASIRVQIAWCAAAGVRRAVFSHCGSQIVLGDPAAVAAQVRSLGRERGVRASIARDGAACVVRRR